MYLTKFLKHAIKRPKTELDRFTPDKVERRNPLLVGLKYLVKVLS
jgi:hypothetical protein